MLEILNLEFSVGDCLLLFLDNTVEIVEFLVKAIEISSLLLEFRFDFVMGCLLRAQVTKNTAPENA